MRNFFIICISVYLGLFLHNGCNKLPIGGDELKVRGDFKPDTLSLNLYSSFTEIKNIPLGTSQNLIAGKNDDYESRILLRFSFPDTAYSGLDEIKLILYRNTTFRRDTIGIAVHLLTSDFTESEVTWFKRANAEFWQTPGGDFESDSLRFYEVRGDSFIVWFNYIDLNKIRNAKGMILIPKTDGFCFFYSREGGQAPSFKLIKNNSVTTIPLTADCHIMKLDNPPNYWDSWLGSGVAFRNFVEFNFDSLLAGMMAVYGELTFKKESHFTFRDSIEIGVRYLTKPFSGFDTEQSPLIALKKFAASDSIFTLDIVEYIQRIIEYPDSNFGICIHLSPENYDIASFKLIGGSHKLKVGYIKPPEERE